MKLARLIMPLFVLPLALLNPGVFSMLRQAQPVREGAALSAENSPSLIAKASAETTINSGLTTLSPTAVSPTQSVNTLLLDRFVASVKNGQAGLVVGVYVPGALALRVRQQPANAPAYVSTSADEATQFRLAADYGAIGLLAHNYLSGALFFNLAVGQEVDIVYGNGAIHRYTIFALRHFQALRPTDPASNFVDIDNNQKTQISNSDLFHQIYSSDRVVFQTCITKEGNTSWGRLFILAKPIL